MPYALFSDDAKLSKTYATPSQVMDIARDAGLVTEVATLGEDAREVLDHNYEIRESEPEPGECPHRNGSDAAADQDFHLSLQGR